MKKIKPYENRLEINPGVTIGEVVWVGANAVMLDGVQIGRGSIFVAGSVVTKSVNPYSIVAGVLAKFIQYCWVAATIIQHESTVYLSALIISPDVINKACAKNA